MRWCTTSHRSCQVARKVGILQTFGVRAPCETKTFYRILDRCRSINWFVARSRGYNYVMNNLPNDMPSYLEYNANVWCSDVKQVNQTKIFGFEDWRLWWNRCPKKLLENACFTTDHQTFAVYSRSPMSWVH